MAFNLQSRTVQESVAPYIKAVVPSVEVTGSGFAAVAASGTITDSAAQFVTAGFIAGDVIRITGSSENANNTTHIIETVAAGTLTLTGASSLVDDAAGDTWFITPIHKPCRAIVNIGGASTIALTFPDGSVASLYLNKAVIYPYACIACNDSDVHFLY
tara:strand:- start:722 stop:1195 length:474 start_codon:yes stop_codon:yes gene_type:complete